MKYSWKGRKHHPPPPPPQKKKKKKKKKIKRCNQGAPEIDFWRESFHISFSFASAAVLDSISSFKPS